MAGAGNGAWEHRHVGLCSAAIVGIEAGRRRGRIVSTQSGVMEDVLKERLLQPVVDLLRQGVTPEKIALSMALGATLGVFPALGWTTILCAIAAFALRLNLPAIQLVNYLVYPAQLALLLPFFRLGEK